MIDLKILEIFLTSNLQSGNFLSQFVYDPGQKPCREGAFKELFSLVIYPSVPQSLGLMLG
jgi:hypothetical protein